MKFILTFMIAFTAVSYSQIRNQNSGGHLEPDKEIPKPDFKIKQYVGIINYDIKKMSKKTNVNLSSKKGESFKKALKQYNTTINDISRINGFLLTNSKYLLDNFQENAIKTGDYSNQQNVMKEIRKNLKPIIETIIIEDKKLVSTVNKILSDKQFKKWKKYNKKIGKVLPKNVL